MILKPETRADLAAQLVEASAAARVISHVDLGAISALVEHHPEDMTATVEAGMTLENFQAALHPHRQWLPIDPPDAASLTIGELLASDSSGPRRLAFGTIRDYLIGIKVALTNGEIIKAGGKVVKNVAGYDLCKLFIGARHSLGIIVEATFKLRPLPETEAFVQARLDSFDDLRNLNHAVVASAANPMILDAHHLSGSNLTLVAAFSGMREDVDAQLSLAHRLGFSQTDPPPYFEAFWKEVPVQKLSVLPSLTVQRLAELKPAEFLAHVGNGIIFYRGGTPPARPSLPTTLMDRVKNAYDPRYILPAYAA